MVHYGEKYDLLNQAELYRAGILLLGFWWGVFSLPTVFILRDRGVPPEKSTPLLRAGWNAVGQVARTLVHVRRYPALMLFLLAFLFYNDGMQTVITQANTLANKELHFSVDELFGLILMIQLIALPGSLLVGWLSDRLGQKPVLLGCLAVWIGLLVAALLIENKGAFWLMGAILALVLGGTQSVGRAMMGLMTPPKHAGEFFGFLNVSGKAASVLGAVQFGAIVYLTGNTRWAAFSLLIFFLIGGALVLCVNVDQGKKQVLDSE
jgi:MFS transporter, UMF1 family